MLTRLKAYQFASKKTPRQQLRHKQQTQTRHSFSSERSKDVGVEVARTPDGAAGSSRTRSPTAPSSPLGSQQCPAKHSRMREEEELSPRARPKRLTGGSLGGSCRALRGCCSGFTAGPLADAVCSACPAGRGEKAGCHGGANQEMVSSKRANTPMIMAHQGPGASGA